MTFDEFADGGAAGGMYGGANGGAAGDGGGGGYSHISTWHGVPSRSAVHVSPESEMMISEPEIARTEDSSAVGSNGPCTVTRVGRMTSGHCGGIACVGLCGRLGE